MARRILVVDDHPLIRLALQHLISQDPELAVCGSVGTVAGAVEFLRSEPAPDLIVLDLILEDGDGESVIEEVAGSGCGSRILVNSVCNDALRVSRIVSSGVAGFVDKGQPLADLIKAIRVILDRGSYLSPFIQQLCIDALRKGLTPESGGNIALLSRRESEIFRLMGKNLNPQEIADSLGISLKTVHTHRQNIRQKLGLRSMAELCGKAALAASNLA